MARNTPIISKTHLRNITNSPVIGQEHDTSGKHWTGTKKTTSAFVNAKLREERLETIPTHRRQIAALTLSKRTNSIWRQEAIRNTGIAAPLLDHKAKRFNQQGCGKFLSLGRAVDSTLFCRISAIASQSSKPTTDTMQQTLQLLNYLATQEDAVLFYHPSDMVFALHSNASYLSEPKARSRAGGHFPLSSETTIPPNNGAVLNIVHIIKNVMSSATKTELAGLYIIAREAVYIRIILQELGHKQPPTPLQTDNAMAMANAVINGKINPNEQKPWRCNFIGYETVTVNNNSGYWRPGKMNYANYWTKHHPKSHCRNIL